MMAIAFTVRQGAAQVVTASTVPTAVKATWRAHFPGITKVEWKVKTDKNFEAEFKYRGADVAAKFTPAGAWLETETTIRRAALPEPVQATIARDFKKYRQIETQRLDRAETPPQLYEVHLDNGKEIVKLQLDPAGVVTSKSVKPKSPASKPGSMS